MNSKWHTIYIDVIIPKYFTSLENQTSAAGRLFWTYGPGQGEITIVAIEPHPNDKANA